MGGNAPRTTYFNPEVAAERNEATARHAPVTPSDSELPNNPFALTVANMVSVDPLTVMVNPFNALHNILY